MIRPLRGVHRGAFVLLALALPALLGSALAGRHLAPLQALPDELDPVAPEALGDGEDLLVYWYHGPVPSDGRLPEDARLVGSLRSGAAGLEPPGATTVLRYSLLAGRVVDGHRPVDPQGGGR